MSNSTEAVQARAAAVSALIEKYEDEFNILHSSYREKAGLDPEPGKRKNRSRLAQLREQIVAAGLEPVV